MPRPVQFHGNSGIPPGMACHMPPPPGAADAAPEPTPELLQLLDAVAQGTMRPEDAATRLRGFAELDFAHVDTDRARRLGFPEAIFGQGKTPADIAEIARTLYSHGQRVLATRVSAEAAEDVRQRLYGLPVRYEAAARILLLEDAPAEPVGLGTVAVVSAGTSDRSARMASARGPSPFSRAISALVRRLGL